MKTFPVVLIAVCFLSLPSFAQTNSLTQRLNRESLEILAADAITFGDPTRGALAFYQPTMNCAKCHEPTQGRRLGPDLSEKRKVEVEHLVESILKPSAQIKEGFETTLVQLEDGRLISGIKTDESDSSLTIDRIEQAVVPLKIEKSEIDEWKSTKKSTMPEDLPNQLADRQQFLDLVCYLKDIATNGPGRALQLKPASAMFAQVPLPEYEKHVDHAGLIRGWNNVSFSRGDEIYQLRCASCHGTFEQEGSMPTSLRFAEGKFKHGNDPYTMYKTLTHGYGMMNAQRWMVPQQKYSVIYYLRKKLIEPHNSSQLFDVTEEYLAGLPTGDTFGPKPVLAKPWTKMDYGPSWFNTIEVSNDGSNIAQKGITIRLDDGPGGVESGKYWMMYDHDTMRVAAAWSEQFIDYHGIHFNGMHNSHPKLTGKIHFQNPVGPGWANPDTDGFEDERLLGRDGKRYGPLDRKWAQYKGMYRFGKQSILKYTVDGTDILESPSLSFIDDQPVFVRTLNVGPHRRDITLQLAESDETYTVESSDHSISVLPPERGSRKPMTHSGLNFDGTNFAQTDASGFDWDEKDFTIVAKIKTEKDGSILALTKDESEWVADGKTLFIRGGRLTFDIGWVDAVRSKTRVADGKWHEIAMTWRAKDAEVRFFVDGKFSGKGELEAKEKLSESVIRLGFTNDNFPGTSFFNGQMENVRFYQRLLSSEELKDQAKIANDKLVASWNETRADQLVDTSGNDHTARLVSQNATRAATGLVAHFSTDGSDAELFSENGHVRLRIPPSKEPCQIIIRLANAVNAQTATMIREKMSQVVGLDDLKQFTIGGPRNYPEVLESETIMGDEDGPFAVDVFVRPTDNPWSCQLRLTGLDFSPDGNTAVVSTWDGGVFRVSGLHEKTTKWKRIAAGLFQPLGIKWIDDKIYVSCRDQICVLHDLNGDDEADFYECFNNDHQVTEHFHEFAMGLQTDEEGNFYYAKSARHALTAIVPHHGTLLKVSADGGKTEIVANGFRAANGVCLNPDGSFVVTDQEGHWNPKNRINWVKPGGFYGNMFGYHDVTDESDEAMDPPLCWITNSFDRSPAELMWVDSPKWGELNGKLLNFSYGYGKVYIVPHEKVGDQMQGGMCAFDLPQFPTGVMRGRFNPSDGQLYCCGMFAWSSSQQQPGGFYRIRRTDKPVYLPIGLSAYADKIRIQFSGPLDPDSTVEPDNWAITSWDLKRTAKYGSDHYNEKRLEINNITISDDRKSVELLIPDLKPTWGMEINYSIKTAEGKRLQNKIHNTIHDLGGNH